MRWLLHASMCATPFFSVEGSCFAVLRLAVEDKGLLMAVLPVESSEKSEGKDLLFDLRSSLASIY